MALRWSSPERTISAFLTHRSGLLFLLLLFCIHCASIGCSITESVFTLTVSHCCRCRCLYAELDSKKKKEAEEVKSKAKPRTIWDKPDIIDVTVKSLTLRWKPSSVPQYAVQVCPVIVQLTLLTNAIKYSINSSVFLKFHCNSVTPLKLGFFCELHKFYVSLFCIIFIVFIVTKPTPIGGDKSIKKLGGLKYLNVLPFPSPSSPSPFFSYSHAASSIFSPLHVPNFKNLQKYANILRLRHKNQNLGAKPLSPPLVG